VKIKCIANNNKPVKQTEKAEKCLPNTTNYSKKFQACKDHQDPKAFQGLKENPVTMVHLELLVL
jgi:hypothetical protein